VTRIYLIAALAFALGLLVGGVIWLNGARKAADQRAKAAVEAVGRAKTITLEADRAHDIERRVTERTFTNVERIQNASGAADPLPADVRSAWARGLHDNAVITGDAAAKPDQPVP
jgi:hypothetical protein